MSLRLPQAIAIQPRRTVGERIAVGIDRAQAFLRPRTPFTALNTVSRHLDREASSLLDVGCGRGEPMRFLGGKLRLFSTGVDIFTPYLRECQRAGVHSQYVRCDVRRLPFRAKSFDVVLCMEVLEHLAEAEGGQLIGALERLARHQVIFTTPVGEHEQHEFDDNAYQAHQHIWAPAEMKERGYKVWGHGLRNLGGMSGIQSPLPLPLRPLVDVLWVFAGLISRFRPELAGHMVCIKNLERGRGG